MSANAANESTSRRPTTAAEPPTPRQKRATESSTAKFSKNRRSPAGRSNDSDRANSETHTNRRSHVQTFTRSNARKKRATESSTAKFSENQRSNAPTTVAEIVQRAIDDQKTKYSNRKRISLKDYLNLPQTKAYLHWYDKKIYAPIRKIEDRLRKEDERNRAEARALNLKWRLDAIDAEFNHICNQINGFVKLVMGSYGYHYHRGSWRRRRTDYNQRYLEDSRIESDRIRFYLQRVTAWDPQGGVNCQFAPVSTTAPSASPTTPPLAASEGSAFSTPTANDSRGSAADSGNTTTASYKEAPVPDRAKLPFARPFHPLFPRAMDGTTLMVPRPEPPERPDWAPYVRPKRRRRPSERQVRKLYKDLLLNDDPVPPKGASRYTDLRIFLAELTPLAWQRYGRYFYYFFKRRLDRNSSPPIESSSLQRVG